ncbi:MAG: hypothetical protein ACE5GC_05570 [Acidimicrobiia bacterium]
MSIAIRLVSWVQSLTEEIPPDVAEQLPDDVLQQLRDGVIDKIPEDVVDRLPDAVQDRIPEGLLDLASSNNTFTIVLAIAGVLAVVGFVWGIAKSAIKAALFFALAAAVAWFLFFQQ